MGRRGLDPLAGHTVLFRAEAGCAVLSALYRAEAGSAVLSALLLSVSPPTPARFVRARNLLCIGRLGCVLLDGSLLRVVPAGWRTRWEFCGQRRALLAYSRGSALLTGRVVTLRRAGSAGEFLRRARLLGARLMRHLVLACACLGGGWRAQLLHCPVWQTHPPPREFQGLGRAVGQERADGAGSTVHGHEAAMQMSEAQLEGSFVLGGRPQTLPLRGFKHYRRNAVGTPQGEEAIHGPPEIPVRLPRSRQCRQPRLVAGVHWSLTRWFVHHFDLGKD